MIQRLKNQQGNTLIGALVLMVVLAATAASVVNISGTDSRAYTDNMQSTQALAVGNAGIQWALDKLSNGESPAVTDKAFDKGTFSVVPDANSSLITVIGRVGDAKKTQSINADFSKNCVDLVVSQAFIDGATLQDVKLVKTCNKKAILSKMQLTWDWGECAVGTNCDGTVVVDDINEQGDEQDEIEYEDVGNPPHNKFWICHVPPGNPENRHTIAVNFMGWLYGHSAGNGSHNQDYLGPCILPQNNDDDGDDDVAEEVEEVITCEGTVDSDQALDICTEDDGGAQLEMITLANTTIYNAGSVPTGDSTKTSSGEETDVADAVMDLDGTYNMDITFDKIIPTGAWFTITAEFADGSQLTGLFKAGNQPQPVPVEEDPVGEDDPQGNPDDDESFEVDNGVVIIDPDQEVQLEVIGSAITCGSGGPEIYVKAKLCINNDCQNLWNYSDVDGGETFSTTNSVAGSEFTVEATGYRSNCSNFNVTHDSTDTLQVKTLKNGEQAPSLQGFGGQQSVLDFLAPYLNESGQVVLQENQVIMLFELGVNMSQNPTSSAADFQDLVILMTITDTAE